MYINFDILYKNSLTWSDLFVLQVCQQKEYERLKDVPREQLNDLFTKGFLTTVKGKIDYDKRFLLARNSDKTKRLLKDLEIKDITPEVKELAQKLVNLYESNGFIVQNKKKVVTLLSWFTANTEFTEEQIYSCVENYIMTTQKTYVSQLHNLIWKGESVFSNKWDLSQSKLYSLLTKKS